MATTMDQAVLHLRRGPQYARLVRDAYLEENIYECAERFRHSAEFSEVLKIVGDLRDAKVLDLGAGTGVASYAFIKSGAQLVYAIEPDPSDLVGCGAIGRLNVGMPVKIIDAYGEKIPLPDSTVDVVYARQVLHHAHDLNQVLKECARVLRSGGILLVCREHVVDDENQLKVFLENHPIHRLTGGENAFPLNGYLNAIHSAGLELKSVLGPWDTIINAFPTVRTTEELQRYPKTWLERHFGQFGIWISVVPIARTLVWKWINRPKPGRMYSFVGVKSRNCSGSGDAPTEIVLCP